MRTFFVWLALALILALGLLGWGVIHFAPRVPQYKPTSPRVTLPIKRLQPIGWCIYAEPDECEDI